MLDYIAGSLTGIDPLNEEIVIDNGGLGFRLSVSGRTVENLPEQGEQVTIIAELVANEREFRLYGFLSRAERAFFRLICTQVKNVGPATAIRVLGAGSISRMKDAVAGGEYTYFSSIKGIGKKISERIVRELREYIDRIEPDGEIAVTGSDDTAPSSRADAVKTLITLGFSENTAIDRVNAIIQQAGSDISVEEIVKQALNPS